MSLPVPIGATAILGDLTILLEGKPWLTIKGPIVFKVDVERTENKEDYFPSGHLTSYSRWIRTTKITMETTIHGGEQMIMHLS